MTFEETDGGLDRSHESLGDWNGLQRHRHSVMWPHGAQEEDQWEYDIAPRKGPVPHVVRSVYAYLQESSYL